MAQKNKKQRKKPSQAALSVPFGIKHVAKCPKYVRPEAFDEKLLLKILQNPHTEKYQHEFAKFIFEPNLWGQFHTEYKTKFQPSKIKGMRILIQIGTIHAILSNKYYVYSKPDTEDVDTNTQNVKSHYKAIELRKHSILDSVHKTVMHTEDELFAEQFFHSVDYGGDNKANEEEEESKQEQTILLFNNDILDVAKHIMSKYHLKPLVLVMSSQTYPGGGYRKGAGAQEEDMCRRSTLFCNLDDPYQFRASNKNQKSLWSYPLPAFGGVYSPNVLVFRNGVDHNYSFYEPHPLKMSFVSVYAYSVPNLDANNRLSKTMEKRTLKKIEAILRIAMLHRHRCLILSGFGCGAYENPPAHIAELFKLALAKPEYRRYFTMVVFAIIDDKNTGKAHNPKGNVVPFANVFKIPIMRLPK